jgi:hypothetical protein
MLEYVCKRLGTYVSAVKDTAERLCNLFRENPSIKWERKTVKGLQRLLGYGNYESFKKHVYAILTVSLWGNLAEIVDDLKLKPYAEALRLLPETIVLDPPEREELGVLLDDVKRYLGERVGAIATTVVGASLGAAAGACVDKGNPVRGAMAGATVAAIPSAIVGTILDIIFAENSDYLLSLILGSTPVTFTSMIIVLSELSKPTS